MFNRLVYISKHENNNTNKKRQTVEICNPLIWSRIHLEIKLENPHEHTFDTSHRTRHDLVENVVGTLQGLLRDDTSLLQ